MLLGHVCIPFHHISILIVLCLSLPLRTIRRHEPGYYSLDQPSDLWAVTDSNCWLSGYEPEALTNCANGPIKWNILDENDGGSVWFHFKLWVWRSNSGVCIIIMFHNNEKDWWESHVQWGHINPRWSSIRTRCRHTGNMAMFYIHEVSEHLHHQIQ